MHGQKKKIRNCFTCTKGKNFPGNKSLRKSHSEIKKCVIADTEDFKVALKFNGQNQTMRN